MQLTQSGDSKLIDLSQWDDVESAIKNLDGIQRSEVGLYLNDNCYLQVGGGGDCLVCCIREGEKLFVLTDPIKSETSMKWVIAGEGADYPENECFCRTDILKVVKEFWEGGKRSTEFKWKSF